MYYEVVKAETMQEAIKNNRSLKWGSTLKYLN